MGLIHALTDLTRAALRDDPRAIDELAVWLETCLPRRIDVVIEVAHEAGHPIVAPLRHYLEQHPDTALDDRLWGLTNFPSNAIAPLRIDVGLRKLTRAHDSLELEQIRSECIIQLLLMGRIDEAKPLIDDEITMLRAGGDSPALAKALCRRAQVEPTKFDYVMQLLHEAVDIARRSVEASPGDLEARLVRHICDHDLAQAYAMSDASAARSLYEAMLERARPLAKDARMPHLLAGVLVGYAKQQSSTDSLAAVSSAREALALYRDITDEEPQGWTHRLAGALRDTASIFVAAGRDDEARANLVEAEALFRELCRLNFEHYGEDLAMTLLNLARVVPDAGVAVRLLGDAFNVFVITGRVTYISARIAADLMTRLKELDDPRAAGAAFLAVSHILMYSTLVNHPDRAELLLLVPGLSFLFEPDGSSPLHIAARDLVHAAGILDGASVQDSVRRLRELPDGVLDAIVRRCMRALGELAGRTPPNDLAAAHAFVQARQPKPSTPGQYDKANALLRLASEEAQRGRHDAALATYDAVLREDIPPDAVKLVWFKKGTVFAARGDQSAAEDAYLRALESPAPAALVEGTFNNLVSLLSQTPQRFHEALACALIGTGYVPESSMLWAQAARALYYMDRYAEAMVAAERAFELDSSSRMAAQIWTSAQQHVEEIEQRLSAALAEIRARPDALPAWRAAMVALLNLGRHDEMFSLSERALADHPAWHSIRSLRAVGWLARGSWDEATREAQLALAANPDNPEALFARDTAQRTAALLQRMRR